MASANMWGLDVQQVRQLSSQLNQKATEIENALSTLTSTLGQTDWNGPDATHFRNDWSGQHTSALRQVIQALRDAANKAQQNAAAQEQVSNAN
ncbi:MAG: WXG100 family type VII secretion target [Micropruina sp.]|uniref:WXG100 family type VII secretion target n=1 Tax=Micropruina sp. TaxID=2737536 RepID=UPI0039E3462D